MSDYDPYRWPDAAVAHLLAGLAATRKADDKAALDRAIAECRYCHDAIHDGNCCIECARDLRALGVERDREWGAA